MEKIRSFIIKGVMGVKKILKFLLTLWVVWFVLVMQTLSALFALLFGCPILLVLDKDLATQSYKKCVNDLKEAYSISNIKDKIEDILQG